MFRFQVIVVNTAKHEFSAETDMPWDDFRDRAAAYLVGTPAPIQLAYKILESGRVTNLSNSRDFEIAMGLVCTKALNARVKAVAIEVRNAVSTSQRSEFVTQLTNHTRAW